MAPRDLLTRLLPAGALGATAALLVSCGSGGTGLIPAADAGPLQTDFNSVAQAVSSGDCHSAITALHRARHDFNALPPTVNAALHKRLSDGLVNLNHTAPRQCAQSATSSTSSSSFTQTTPLPTTQSTPSTSDTTTTPPTSSSTSTSSQTQPSPSSSSSSGGTPSPANPPTGGTHLPGDGANGKSKGQGNGNGNGGGGQ